MARKFFRGFNIGPLVVLSLCSSAVAQVDCDAQCRGQSHKQQYDNYHNPPGEPSRRSDPVDDAMGQIFIELLKKGYENAQKREGDRSQSRQADPATPKPTQPVALLDFSGVARDARRRMQWPFQLLVEDRHSDSGEFTGRIIWPSLGSIHSVSGIIARDRMYFREEMVLRRGRAVLGCEYWFREAVSSEMRGRYECSNGPGQVQMNLN